MKKGAKEENYNGDGKNYKVDSKFKKVKVSKILAGMFIVLVMFLVHLSPPTQKKKK